MPRPGLAHIIRGSATLGSRCCWSAACVSPAVRFEILFSARDGTSFGALAERHSAIQAAPLNTSVIRSAEQAMRTLAHRSPGAQRLLIIDYLVAAAALELGAAVIHYDQDYDTLADLMGFDSVWLAPAGTLP